MKYKEFKVHVLDEESILATFPSGVTRKGKVQRDNLKKKTIEMFHRFLELGNIEEKKHLKIIGSHLYGVLFSGEIDTEFKKAFDERSDPEDSEDTYLRVVLEFEQDSKELATLPWEYLYYPDSEREKGFLIATRSKLILTRHVPLNTAFATLKPSEKPLRILIVTSQPNNLKTVLADKVIEAIEGLSEKFPKTIEIIKIEQPDKRTFLDEVSKIKPHVMHFVGHGKWDKVHRKGKLAFVNKYDGTAQWIDDESFTDYFQDFQPRLIFLQACKGASSESYEGFSGLALQLVYSKVPAVVAMQFPIENKAAILFANKFYECLGEGQPIDVAVQASRLELGLYLDDEHFSSRTFGSPVVYLQSADGIVIADAKHETVSPETPGPVQEVHFRRLPKAKPVIDSSKTPGRAHQVKHDRTPESQPVIEASGATILPSGKVPCPNPRCIDGLIRIGAKKCLDCGHKLGLCPSCQENIISLDIGKCDKCGYGTKPSGTASPETKKKVEMAEQSPALTDEPTNLSKWLQRKIIQ